MTRNRSDENVQAISLESLSDALVRSKSLIRMVAKSLDVQAQDGSVTLADALMLTRYFWYGQEEQDALWEHLASMLQRCL